MKGAIDFHTHAFPDSLAETAMAKLQAGGAGEKAFHDGRVSSLLRSMDEAGIEQSVICSIATRPAQFEPILKWSAEIRSSRIVPLPSFHPSDENFRENIARIKGEGFKGVKFHPYYQDFFLDGERMFPIYEDILKQGLIIVMHTGFDIAFERERRADPVRVLRVYEKFPELKMVTSHLGGWQQWDEVERVLIGRKIYMEISFSLEYLGAHAADLILRHPREYVLFGTDSPWTGQKETMQKVLALGLPPAVENALLRENALRLLESV